MFDVRGQLVHVVGNERQECFDPLDCVADRVDDSSRCATGTRVSRRSTEFICAHVDTGELSNHRGATHEGVRFVRHDDDICKADE